jgi:hypothetical protein
VSAWIPPSGRNVYVAPHRMLSHRGVDSVGERVLRSRESEEERGKGERGEGRKEEERVNME